ncbi:MAG: hypothetical protein ABWW65_02805 [Thermoprotei archaeon]
MNYRNPREFYREHGSKTPQYPKPRFKPKPLPLGTSCNPLCPLFRCTRGALVVVNKSYRGKIIKEAYCRLSSEKCVGAECKFASCKTNALLPDGKCAKALEKRIRITSDEELFREMQQIEDYDAEDFA